ncbi:AAA family ATPase [Marinobacter sp. DY40_1A1]|uniref:AAA family ATPase n=1 Tax=Marinobacter sp. DY40_1A1 TaxID=2583229 RepID=UPI001908078B|nr:AAA family ATPase [Marinobacter sp. DY40_1A1]MBK1885083.1 AAA family ATPase [Marinobacter sp. DY40_1A1]
MINAFAVSNYRSLKGIVAPLAGLNVVTGANGCGKSNLYKSLRLLAEAAKGNLISSIAQEGGLEYTFWAGPDNFTSAMREGSAPVQGSARKHNSRLRLGFAGEEFSYAISLGMPAPQGFAGYQDPSMFQFDPEIKRECIWVGDVCRPSSCLIDRVGPVVKVRSGRKWEVYNAHLNSYESILNEISDPVAVPEVHAVRQTIRNWRFYDQFRTDPQSAIRTPQIGTRTPVLDHDGHSLVAALRTIHEIGDRQALYHAIEDAFPGATINFSAGSGNRFVLEFLQDGLLRPLNQAELSDGTLRYLLLVAALLTPRPPSLLVLNEPETSLHPDLLPALGRLIIRASRETQVWVVSHAPRLVATLERDGDCNSIALNKELGETVVVGQGLLDAPAWQWPD